MKKLSIKKFLMISIVQLTVTAVTVLNISPIVVQAAEANTSKVNNYANGNVASIAANTKAISVDGLYNKAVNSMEILPQGSLTRAKSAIKDGTLRIAFLGDSITEGADLSSYSYSYASQVSEELKKALPGVNVITENFSLGARNLGHLVNDNYKAVDRETDHTFNFHRNWSVTGKSWKDHVKDFNPDLLIVAFGMNDAMYTDSDETFGYNLDKFVNFTKTWTKIPDLVLVPTMLPTSDNSRYTQRQDITNAVAAVAREYARVNGYICADANRLFQILRDGKDVEATYSATANNPSEVKEFKNGTIEFYATFKSAGDDGGRNIIYRNNNMGSIIIQMKANDDGTGTASLYLSGSDSTYVTIGSSKNITYDFNELGEPITIINQGENVKVSPVQTVKIPSLQLNNTYKVRIEANGINHKVYFDDTLLMDISKYKKVIGGTIAARPTGKDPFEIKNFTVKADVSYTETPNFTEDELLGKYNDPTESGNGINHLNDFGQGIVYTKAFNGIVNELKKSYTGSGN